MAIGYFIQKNFSLDLKTLVRLNIYYLMPGFIFVRLYETDILLGLFVKVLGFIIFFVIILFILSNVIGRILGLSSGEKVTLTNSVMFFNSGNYGVPVNDLVFRGDPFAMSIQVVVLMFQNILIFSYGIFSLQAVTAGKWRALL